MRNTVIIAVGAIFMLFGQTAFFAVEAEGNRPLLLANYYAWYHDGEHPRWPWAGWTRPEASGNSLALAAQRANPARLPARRQRGRGGLCHDHKLERVAGDHGH